MLRLRTVNKEVVSNIYKETNFLVASIKYIYFYIVVTHFVNNEQKRN